jgi:hypothetical protein
VTHQFIPFQKPKAFQHTISRWGFGFARLMRWFGGAVRHTSAGSLNEVKVCFHSAIFGQFSDRTCFQDSSNASPLAGLSVVPVGRDAQ